MALISVPVFDKSPRIRTSETACSPSLEHWNSTSVLLSLGLLPLPVVVHRTQFKALARSVAAVSAPDTNISKQATKLSLESEQAAKNMPQTAEIMQDLAEKAPPQAL